MEFSTDRRNSIIDAFYENLSEFEYNPSDSPMGVDRFIRQGMEIKSTFSNDKKVIELILPVVAENKFWDRYTSDNESINNFIYSSNVPVIRYDDSISQVFFYDLDGAGQNYRLPIISDSNRLPNFRHIEIHSGYIKSLNFDLLQEMNEDIFFQLSTVNDMFIDCEQYIKLQRIIKSTLKAVIYDKVDNTTLRYMLTTKLSTGA